MGHEGEADIEYCVNNQQVADHKPGQRLQAANEIEEPRVPLEVSQQLLFADLIANCRGGLRRVAVRFAGRIAGRLILHLRDRTLAFVVSRG